MSLKKPSNISTIIFSIFSTTIYASNDTSPIISDEHANIILYFDISNIRHNVKDIVQLHLEYFDSNSNDNIIFYDSQIYNNTIVGNVDSLVVDIAPLIQKYLVNDTKKM